MNFTYVLFVILFFVFDFISGSQVISNSANAIFQNIDLVEIVKNDLQRNNEDYGEIKYDYKLSSASEGYYGFTKKSTKTVNNIFKSQRRANVDSTEYNNYDDNVKSTIKEAILITNASTKVNSVHELLRTQSNKERKKEKLELVKKLIANKLSKINIIKPLIPRVVTPTTNATQSLLIKDTKMPKFKIDKFKKFLLNNKGLVKDFWSSKIDILTQKTTSKNPLRTISTVSNNNKAKGMLQAIQNIKISDDDKIHLLYPDLLDMAPANGGRFYRQRVKGRLCQRHVLMPEGPKYDSHGKWYLPAHNLVVSRPYNVTAPPKLILPRCCNCCKKSVLGCE